MYSEAMKTLNNPLEKILAIYGGNVTHAARACGVSRVLMHIWIRQGFIPWRRDLHIEQATNGAVTAAEVREYAAWARK